MVIKYVPVICKSVDEEAEFLISFLNYKMIGKLSILPEIECRLMKHVSHDSAIVLIPETESLKGKRVVLLNTEQCLKDCISLKKSEHQDNVNAYYTQDGLLATFQDNSDNHFILFEERTYEEI